MNHVQAFYAGQCYKFNYINYRGETALRNVRFLFLEYNSAPGFNYPPGWFAHCFDFDKKADRSFLLSNISLIQGQC